MSACATKASGSIRSCLPDPLTSENMHGTSGRGIFLMRAFMDDVTVQRAANGGTEIAMRKAVKP